MKRLCSLNFSDREAAVVKADSLSRDGASVVTVFKTDGGEWIVTWEETDFYTTCEPILTLGALAILAATLIGMWVALPGNMS